VAIKSGKMGWAGHVAWTGELRRSCKDVVGKQGGQFEDLGVDVTG
jgi:hypothetical protein